MITNQTMIGSVSAIPGLITDQGGINIHFNNITNQGGEAIAGINHTTE